METVAKKYIAKRSSLEQAAGDGPMMVFLGVRSNEEVRIMSEWASNRKAELIVKDGTAK